MFVVEGPPFVERGGSARASDIIWSHPSGAVTMALSCTLAVCSTLQLHVKTMDKSLISLGE